MRIRAVTVMLAMLLACGVCVLEDSAVRTRPKSDAEQVSSVYALAGEFRTVFANLLWVKADEYHHEFVEHEPDWTKNHELLGLLDLIIALDPSFVEAYADKSYIYAEARSDTRGALSILRQGISNNPRSRELHELAALFYARRLNSPEKAIPYAQKAVEYAEDEWYRARARRLLHNIEKLAAEDRAKRPA